LGQLFSAACVFTLAGPRLGRQVRLVFMLRHGDMVRDRFRERRKLAVVRERIFGQKPGDRPRIADAS